MNALDLVFPVAIAASTIVTLAIKEQNKKTKELEQLLSADGHRQLVPDIRTENMRRYTVLMTKKVWSCISNG